MTEKRVNLLIAATALAGLVTLIAQNHESYQRRIAYWLTNSVVIDGLTFHLNPDDEVISESMVEWGVWEDLGERLRAAGHPFVIEPRVRFRGEVGEQGTFFVRDPAGNALEFKSFRDPRQLFAQ